MTVVLALHELILNSKHIKAIKTFKTVGIYLYFHRNTYRYIDYKL